MGSDRASTNPMVTKIDVSIQFIFEDRLLQDALYVHLTATTKGNQDEKKKRTTKNNSKII